MSIATKILKMAAKEAVPARVDPGIKVFHLLPKKMALRLSFRLFRIGTTILIGITAKLLTYHLNYGIHIEAKEI